MLDVAATGDKPQNASLFDSEKNKGFNAFIFISIFTLSFIIEYYKIILYRMIIFTNILFTICSV